MYSLAYLGSDFSEDMQLTTEEARTVTLAKKMKFSEMPAALRMAEIAPCRRAGSVEDQQRLDRFICSITSEASATDP